MSDELSSDTMVRLKLTVALSILLGVATSTAAAVGAIYHFRDQIVPAPGATQSDLWKAIHTLDEKQEGRYDELQKHLGQLDDKVDGVIIYLRKKL